MTLKQALSLALSFFLLTGVLGCDNTERVVISNIQVVISESIPTVATVSWTTNRPTRDFVEFGIDAPGELSTPQDEEASTNHQAILLGMTASQEYQFQIVAEAVDLTGMSDILTLTTGALPSELPALTQTGSDNDLYIIVPVLGGVHAVVIIDPAGEIVWFHLDDRGLDTYRARLARDGQGIIYNAGSISGDPAENSQIVRVSFDGETEETIDIPLLAHDFVELPDETIGAIVVEIRDHNGQDVKGNQLVEVSPDGTQNVVWSSWDCYDPDVTVGDDFDTGWTFANALDYDEEENAYYLGMRNFSSIVKISRETWDCEFAIGGAANTFDFIGGASIFHHQHQFDWVDGNIVIFDNDGATGQVSRVVEYQIDVEAQTVQEVWEYMTDPTLFSFVLGDVTRLDDGDTMVNWATAGQIERVSPEGQSTWRVNTGLAYAFGFHELVPNLYQHF